jgi:hypothetical protein
MCGSSDREDGDESGTGRPVDVLNLARGLAVDTVSTHLFEENYNGTSEKGPRLFVSAFVDAFVAVGRFFYLPTSVFTWLEWTIEKFMPDEHTNMSMEVVDKFVSNLVDGTLVGPQNYPGRLKKLGLSDLKSNLNAKILSLQGQIRRV